MPRQCLWDLWYCCFPPGAAREGEGEGASHGPSVAPIIAATGAERPESCAPRHLLPPGSLRGQDCRQRLHSSPGPTSSVPVHPPLDVQMCGIFWCMGTFAELWIFYFHRLKGRDEGSIFFSIMPLTSIFFLFCLFLFAYFCCFG